MIEKKVLEDEEAIQSLAEVAREIEKMEDARNVRLEATHGRFNLFTTLLAAHDEVRLHTRYLTHLLDLKGEHDCKRLFLDAFLDVFLESESGLVDHEGIQLDADVATALVKALKEDEPSYVNNEENRPPYGQFDIFLEFENHTVLIENKIHASEGEDQLKRYAAFLEVQETQRKKTLLLYLTLDGKCSETADGKPYYRISYKDHILPWLEVCLQKTYEFVNINQALQQYQSVVNRLLGNTLEKEDMDKIKELIRNNPKIINHSRQIRKVLEEIELAPLEQAKKKGNDLGVKAHIESGNWGGGSRAVRFSKSTWGKDSIVLTVFPSGGCDLFAFVCDVNSSEREARLSEIMDGYSIKNEGKYKMPYCCEKDDLDEVLKELKGFVDRIDRYLKV